MTKATKTAKRASVAVGTLLFALLVASTGIAISITSTGADGIAVYSVSPGRNPGYRIWNQNTTSFTSSASDTQNTTNPTEWLVLKANHERNEMIMGMETSGTLAMSTQIFNGTNWGNLAQHTTSIISASQRGFDIAYEDISGDALITYESTTGNDGILSYKIWNGTGYTPEQNATFTNLNRQVRWIQLISKPGTNDIMLVAMDDANGNQLAAMLWNGTSFESSTEVAASSSVNTDTEEEFHFAWERTSGDGLLVYGTSSSSSEWAYRTYTSSVKSWSSEAAFLDLNGGSATFVRLCSDPDSDAIGFISYDTTNDVNVRIWNGSAAETSPAPPSEETDTEHSTAARHIGCQWEASGNEVLFTWADNDALAISYTNYTHGASSSWGTSDLQTSPTTAAIGADDLRSVMAAASPTSDEIMYLAGDISENLTTIRWNGTAFTSSLNGPAASSLQCTDAQTECFMVAWDQYDTAPTASSVQPNGTTVALGRNVAINATVIDNVNVSSVLANITFPNGTSDIMAMLDDNNDNIFNATLRDTSQQGTYNLTIIANDSGTHQNRNANASVQFSAMDMVLPTATNLTLPNGQAYRRGEVVAIRASVTDDRSMDTVLANVTMPNGSSIMSAMTDLSGATEEYELNFTATQQRGVYNITVIANDSSNNINRNQTTFFTAGDFTNPAVQTPTPAAGTSINLNDLVMISANVTDNANISTVLASITLPNGSGTAVAMANGSDGIFSGTFIGTSIAGTYNITIIANDSENNTNNTAATYFSVGDTQLPLIALISPANGTNTSSITVVFNATVTDNSNTLNCSLLIDGTVLQTNSSIANNTIARFSHSSLSNAAHAWSIRCTDNAGNTNQSASRTATVDSSGPTVYSITLTPNSTDDVDPDKEISVAANATDTLMAVVTVLFQERLATDAAYTNHTATRQANGLFGTSFTPSDSGTRIYRVVAVDSLGNRNITGEQSLSVTQEVTWTRLPAIAPAVSALAGSNATIASLIINNTGDVALNFSVSSSYTNVGMNASFPIQVNAGTITSIEVNATAPAAAGNTTVLLAINTTDGQASPQAQNTTVLLSTTASTGAGSGGSSGGGSGTSSGGAGGTDKGGSKGGLTTGSSVGGSAPLQLQPTITEKQLVETVEVVDLVRGKETAFAISVTNVFANTTLKNIRLSLGGYLSEELQYTPESIDSIEYGATGEFIVTLRSPAYQDNGEHELAITITGKAVSGLGAAGQNATDMELSEKRNVLIIIQDYSKEDAERFFAEAAASRDAIAVLGLPTAMADSLLEQMQASIAERKYDGTKDLRNKILDLADAASATSSALASMEESFNAALKNGANMSETQEQLELARAAFAQGDFLTAAERLKEARRTYLIETKGLGFLSLLANYKAAVVPLLIALGVLSVMLYRRDATPWASNSRNDKGSALAQHWASPAKTRVPTGSNWQAKNKEQVHHISPHAPHHSPLPDPSAKEKRTGRNSFKEEQQGRLERIVEQKRQAQEKQAKETQFDNAINNAPQAITSSATSSSADRLSMAELAKHFPMVAAELQAKEKQGVWKQQEASTISAIQEKAEKAVGRRREKMGDALQQIALAAITGQEGRQLPRQLGLQPSKNTVSPREEIVIVPKRFIPINKITQDNLK